MCLSSNIGMDIILPDKIDNIYTYLFNEEIGLVIEVENKFVEEIFTLFINNSIEIIRLGKTNNCKKLSIKIYKDLGYLNIYNENIINIKKKWEDISLELEEKQCNHECVKDEYLIKYLLKPKYNISIKLQKLINKNNNLSNIFLNNNYSTLDNSVNNISNKNKNKNKNKIKFIKINNNNLNTNLFIKNSKIFNVGIIRDEGSNGDKEMAAAFYYAGFNVIDINLYDLINKKKTLENLRGIVFVGGFTHKDILGSAHGWFSIIKENTDLLKQFKDFYRRNDTFLAVYVMVVN